MKNKIQKVILCGAGASGKDYIGKQLISKYGYKYSVSCTTRPPRSTEKDGVDYHFITLEDFQTKIKNGEFKEYNVFKENWHYGTLNTEFEQATLFIMTPSGVRALTEEERKQFIIIYFNTPEEVRRERLKMRKDADDVERRIEADKKDFEGFNLHHCEVTIPDATVEDIYDLIQCYSEDLCKNFDLSKSKYSLCLAGKKETDNGTSVLNKIRGWF
jgi:guanylate kinase